MAPHLTRDELQWLHSIASSGTSVVDTYELLVTRRKKARKAIPGLTTIRRALKHFTCRCAAVETHGRKRKLSKRAAGHGEDSEEVVQNCGLRELRWSDLTKASRVKVHRSTAKRSLEREGIKMAWRRSREKPQWTAEHTERKPSKAHRAAMPQSAPVFERGGRG